MNLKRNPKTGKDRYPPVFGSFKFRPVLKIKFLNFVSCPGILGIADQPNFLAILITGANLVPDRPLVTEPIVAPQTAATAEYGEFMTSFLDCKNCHGDDLNGGTNPINPKGPSLRLVKAWTEEQFITTLRTGVDPSGHELSALMPWRSTGRLDDVELSALYQYLISLP